MTLHAIGDSHAWLPFFQIPGVVTHYTGPVTMKRIGHPDEPLLHDTVRACEPTPADALLFSFGEVDIRCWAYVHATQRHKEPEIFLREWAKRYVEKVATAPANGARLCILAVVPPRPAEQAQNVDFPVAGSDAHRRAYTAMINRSLAMRCHLARLTFLDVYRPYCGPDGMMLPELADNSVHIGDVTKLRAVLAEHGLI